MKKVIFLCVVALGLGLTVQAQTKISGSSQCSKPDQQNAIEIGDKPGHSFAIAKQTCTWTKPLEIAGATNKEYTSAISSDVNGTKEHDRGIAVDSWSSGDKSYVHWQGNGTVQDGKATGQEGTWTFAGGTGKLKGIQGKGKGTYTASGDGSTCEVEGEYELAK
jgi:hypothetical protein